MMLINTLWNFFRSSTTIPHSPTTIPQPAARPVPSVQGDNPLAGLPLSYLIGANNGAYMSPLTVRVVEVGYDTPATKSPFCVGYCNLFNEKYTKQSAAEREALGPYLTSADTAVHYGEGQIDPKGQGWMRNLMAQFNRRAAEKCHYIELANADAYSVNDVLGAVDLAASQGFKVLAKNPLAVRGDPLLYIKHPAVVGAIVEKGAGSPENMNKLRMRAGRPALPVWFVAWNEEGGNDWIQSLKETAYYYINMGGTYSKAGKYISCEDIFLPTPQPERLPWHPSIPKAILDKWDQENRTELNLDGVKNVVVRQPPAPFESGGGSGLLQSNAGVRRPPATFAERILAMYKRYGFIYADAPDTYNVLYVEGCDKQGRPNQNRPDAFDDVRIVWEILSGVPRIAGIWWATTEPGSWWTHNRMNPKGAFHVAIGIQQACWCAGFYHDQPAWVQCENIRGTRDNDEDFKRVGDPVDVGQFGVHHHGTPVTTRDHMGRSSAGCLVGFEGHAEFMQLTKKDVRYLADPGRFRLMSTVVPVTWVQDAS